MNAKPWLVWIVLLYVAASILPAFGRAGAPQDYVPGIMCLILCPIIIPPWWANPLFFAGCIYLARGNARRARQLGAVASVLALSLLLTFELRTLRIGALLWISSILVLAVAGEGLDRGGAKRPKPRSFDEV
jgi:hypothetical protein